MEPRGPADRKAVGGGATCLTGAWAEFTVDKTPGDGDDKLVPALRWARTIADFRVPEGAITGRVRVRNGDGAPSKPSGADKKKGPGLIAGTLGAVFHGTDPLVITISKARIVGPECKLMVETLLGWMSPVCETKTKPLPALTCRGGRRGRLAGRPARASHGRGARHRHRLDRGEA